MIVYHGSDSNFKYSIKGIGVIKNVSQLPRT